MRISDWSSDVCSSDLPFAVVDPVDRGVLRRRHRIEEIQSERIADEKGRGMTVHHNSCPAATPFGSGPPARHITFMQRNFKLLHITCRSEEHTSELQSLMRTSYAVFCLKKKNTGQTDI